MSNSDIIDRLYHRLSSGNLRYPKWELATIVEPFLETLKEILEEGNDIRLKNFGKFVVKVKKGRKYYNIQTGTMDATKDKRMIVFVQHRSFDSPHKEDTKE